MSEVGKSSMLTAPSSMMTTTLLLLVMSIGVTTGTGPPNILFIMADDLGWDDVSFHGSTQIPTPNIDTLVYDGIMLSNYYVQPICSPSRAALLTGKLPIHIGFQTGVIMGSDKWGLGLKEKLLPQYLKELGYATHMIGKWHIGYMTYNHTPTYRGFDSHYGYFGGCEDYWDHTYSQGQSIDPRVTWGLDFFDDVTPDWTGFGQYSTELFTQRAEKIIAAHDTTKPFFMYLPHQAPHNGLGRKSVEAPEKYLKKFDHIPDVKRKTYAAMVSALDDGIGNVTKALAARGMLNNTIIAFSSDNGGPCQGYSSNYACNEPLRGMKYTLWEGGVHVNGWLWSPLLKKSSYNSHHMMHIVDWLPTLLDAAGYDLSKLPAGLDGVSLWRSLSDNSASPRTEMLLNIDTKQEHNYALRSGDMKIKFGHDLWGDGWYRIDESRGGVCEYHPQNKSTHSSSQKGRSLPAPIELNNYNIPVYTQYSSRETKHSSEPIPEMFRSEVREVLEQIGRKSVEGTPYKIDCGGPMPSSDKDHCFNQPCLFNITADPCEYHDLAEQMPEVVAQLLARVKAYNETAVPSLSCGADPKGWPIFHHGVWAPWLNANDLDFK